MLLRCLGGRLQDVLGLLAPDGTGNKPLGSALQVYDRALTEYLRSRGETYPGIATFRPLIESCLRLDAEGPSLDRLRALFDAGIEGLAAHDLDRHAGNPVGTFAERLGAIQEQYTSAGLAEKVPLLAEARHGLDEPDTVAEVAVRGRLRRYKILHHLPQGLELSHRLWVTYSHAEGDFVLREDGVSRPLRDEGELAWRENRHPYRIFRLAGRTVFEIEVYYGEIWAYVSAPSGVQSPVFRLGERQGKIEFEWEGARDFFEPLVEFHVRPRSVDQPTQYGIVVREADSELGEGLTLQGRSVATMETGKWINLEPIFEMGELPHFEIPSF